MLDAEGAGACCIGLCPTADTIFETNRKAAHRLIVSLLEGIGMPTSKDVAALAGVSISTVSYVLSGKRSISQETRERVHRAIEQLTYQPNAGARALRERKTYVLALVVHLGETTDVAGVVPFITTVTAAARQQDYDTVLVTTEEGPGALARLAGRSIVDAFVLMDIRDHDERIDTAVQLDLPVVLIGSPEDTKGLDAVDYDVTAAGALAVDEMVDSNCSRIVVIGDPPEIEHSGFRFIQEFHDGAAARASTRGVRLDVCHPLTAGWPGVLDLEDEIFRPHEGELGIIARTPQAITWTLQLLLLKGMAPGRDVRVVGLCTDEAAVGFSVAVTNVSPEPQEVSRSAMRILFDRLAGQTGAGALRLIAPRLTRRSTTGPTD